MKLILELASKVVLLSFYKYAVFSIEFQHLFLIRDLEIKISPPEEESGKGKGEALHVSFPTNINIYSLVHIRIMNTLFVYFTNAIPSTLLHLCVCLKRVGLPTWVK